MCAPGYILLEKEVSMRLEVDDGVYIVAVSGGVDSMSLLHTLVRMSQYNPKLKLVVAHCNHGIRSNADEDRKFVQASAQAYGVPFVYRNYDLGPHASEDRARQVRYGFLYEVKQAARAQAIITAHHEQDVVETAVLHMLRGTGRRGLSSMHQNHDVLRPLLHLSKEDIIEYAKQHSLDWVEDHTNQDTKYTRNYVRHTILPRLTVEQNNTLRTYVHNAHELNQKIDAHLLTLIHAQISHRHLRRSHIVQLPFSVSVELIAAWLRQHGCRDFDTPTLHRITIACRTAAHGTTHVVRAGFEVFMSPQNHAVLREV